MQLQLYSLNVSTSPALHAHAERRFHTSMARILQRIGHVVIRVADLNGPRGGSDMQCNVRVQVLGGDTIAIREADQCLYRAIDRAASKADRLVKEKLKQRRMKRRRKPHPRSDMFDTPPLGGIATS